MWKEEESKVDEYKELIFILKIHLLLININYYHWHYIVYHKQTMLIHRQKPDWWLQISGLGIDNTKDISGIIEPTP